MSRVKYLLIRLKDTHNALVYFLIRVSLEAINSSTYMLTQDTVEHSSAAAFAVSNTVDTELTVYSAECKNYSAVIGTGKVKSCN